MKKYAKWYLWAAGIIAFAILAVLYVQYAVSLPEEQQHAQAEILMWIFPLAPLAMWIALSCAEPKPTQMAARPAPAPQTGCMHVITLTSYHAVTRG